MLSTVTKKNLHRWLPGYARHVVERMVAPTPTGPRHVLFAICDHFEPLWSNASAEVGLRRVQSWVARYPRLADEFRDADGRPPRHTFFFPVEQYRPEYLDALAELTRASLGEVELHLHHDADTAAGLRETLLTALESFSRHGHLCRDSSGRVRYGFVHGNWCLADSRPDGRWCGVPSELQILFETGCYADFTFPSAPDPTQPRVVDQIYWPIGDLSKARGHERGERARVGRVLRDRILIIEGPLALTRKGRMRLRIENGALSARDPPTRARVKSWIAQSIHVAGRPEWVFVKVHTHGAPEAQADSLLGTAGRALHDALGRLDHDRRFVLHYVTTREMFNVALAAMDGRSGDPNDYRNYELSPPKGTS